MNKDIININNKNQYHGYQEWYIVNILYKMKDSIINKNNKNQNHGYQEWYGSYGKLDLRGKFKNDNPVGYIEVHWLKKTKLYIK